MLTRKKSWDMSLDSLSDTMTNGVGILILILLSVAPMSIRGGSSVSQERTLQAQYTDLEAYLSQLRQQWEKLKAEEPQKQAEMEALQARLSQLQRLAAASPDALADGLSMKAEDLQTLLQTVAAKREQITEVQRAIKEISAKLSRLQKALQDKEAALALDKELESLRESVDQLNQQHEYLDGKLAKAKDDQARVAQQQEDLEKLEREIPKLERQLEKRRSLPQWPTGTYSGPFILVECSGDGARVYPGKKHLPIEASEDQKNWLRERVRETEAVLVLARPSSFKESYPQFVQVVTELVNEEKIKGKTIVMTLWPIEEYAAIDKYIPKGDTHE